MRDILARASRGVLERFAGSRALLALDFDGTLAPIVTDPDRAAMRPSTRRLLRRVARVYPTVVLSGRSRADVERRVLGLGLAGVVGNHGMEPWHTPARAPGQARLWVPHLEERLAGLRGIVIEDKGLTLAVHYRRSPQKEKARARILDAAARLGRVRLVRGKQVVNVLPAGGPHKGQALELARSRLGCDTAIFVGDDETDEDVFSLSQPERLLGIRVGRRGGSDAAWCIQGQAAIDRLLRALLALRPKVLVARGRKARSRPGRRASLPSGALPPLGGPLEFMRLLWAIDHALQRRSKQMAATLGVTGPQRLVIRVVGRFPGISAGQLAEVLHLHPSTLTGILRRLEGRGYLARRPDPRDGRRARFCLAAGGRDLGARASGTIESVMKPLLAALPAGEIRAARRVLSVLSERLAPHRKPPGLALPVGGA